MYISKNLSQSSQLAQSNKLSFQKSLIKLGESFINPDNVVSFRPYSTNWEGATVVRTADGEESCFDGISASNFAKIFIMAQNSEGKSVIYEATDNGFNILA